MEKIINDDMLNLNKYIGNETIDSIVCDPPYGLTSITKRFGKADSSPAKFGTDGSFSRISKGFMGQTWDGTGIEYNVDAWRKCYDALKPGGYLLAFGGSRTFHRIACAIEDAGFEIRDTIMYVYATGFPKSFNVGLAIDKKNGVESKVIGMEKHDDFSKHKGSMMSLNNVEEHKSSSKMIEVKETLNEWQGYGSCLKPAYEPIIVARKPFNGTLVDNILKYRTGALNIDECRISYNGETPNVGGRGQHSRGDGYGFKALEENCIANTKGRFPANFIHDGSTEACDGFPVKNKKNGSITKKYKLNNNVYGEYGSCNTFDSYNDLGSASRYFYCAKASKKDRDEGLDVFEEGKNKDEKTKPSRNTHPTVKPTSLMQYLVRLVTPNGGTVLDPFMGSGSTGKAVIYENKERGCKI